MHRLEDAHNAPPHYRDKPARASMKYPLEMKIRLMRADGENAGVW